MKISFLCFDLSDNSLGRAALLAKALSQHHEVELIGPARGGEIWFPLRELDLPIKLFPWKRYPAFASTIWRMVREIDGDVLYACKLRPTSFGIGLLKKAASGKPLVVDIDDWELGFFYHSNFWGRIGRFLNLSNPNGLPYTWLMEKLARFADAVTVSNRFLEERFPGTVLYHCRDTKALDPARFDSERAKEELGLGGKKVLMFLGTPRAHKGVDDLIAALAGVKDRETRLVIIGADEGKDFPRERLGAVAGRVLVLPKIPFPMLPQRLAAADIVVIPQRRTSDTVGQMPAKLFDAMAMAKPIISTRVSDIPEVLDDCGYLVEPGNVKQLASAIDYVSGHPEEARLKGQRARQRCVEFYDTRALAARLLEMLNPFEPGRKASGNNRQ
ncbi:MAG: glycosyltransferase family 4 protein [Nitrospinaceae bacterium]